MTHRYRVRVIFELTLWAGDEADAEEYARYLVTDNAEHPDSVDVERIESNVPD